MNTVPKNLLKDRYWAALIYLFTNHPKLKRYFTTKYFDLEGESVEVNALESVSKSWSPAERFMLSFALHLFNSRNMLPSDGLATMDSLDHSNMQLVQKALKIRFGS